MAYYVYIMASAKNGTLYIGVTNDVIRRAAEHKEGRTEGFTQRHEVKRLVYVEAHEHAENAIQREKTLKRWNRDWKIALIERDNPQWEDLYDGLCG